MGACSSQPMERMERPSGDHQAKNRVSRTTNHVNPVYSQQPMVTGHQRTGVASPMVIGHQGIAVASPMVIGHQGIGVANPMVIGHQGIGVVSPFLASSVDRTAVTPLNGPGLIAGNVDYENPRSQSYQRTQVVNAGATHLINRTEPSASIIGTPVSQPASVVRSKVSYHSGSQHIGYQGTRVPNTIAVATPVYSPTSVTVSKVGYQDSGFQSSGSQTRSTRIRTQPVIVNDEYENSAFQKNSYRIARSFTTAADPSKHFADIKSVATKVYDPVLDEMVYALDDNVSPVGGPETVAEPESLKGSQNWYK